LHRPGGFSLYTDHRNLKYIFNPQSVVAAVPKYTADKLQRWALLLMSYEYTIQDIPGEDNVWADLLSRWGSRLTNIKFDADSSLNLTSDFRDQIAHNSEGHVIETLKAHQWNTQAKCFQFLVKWRGLTAAEDSWEDSTFIFKEVPAMVKKYLRALRADPQVQQMIKEMGISFQEGGVGPAP
jgi:Chromo (CHRromatin Organisation MOdifier) domain/RNase H-like domain found in reverse transcriptase